MFRSSFLLPLMVLPLLGLQPAFADWPRFLGPDQNHSEAKGLPLTWNETEHVKWKTALPGEGWSSPVVENGMAWMTTATMEGKSLRVLCVDVASGRLLRDVEVFQNETVPPKHRRNSYASPTPALDGDRIYVHFGTMGTACLSTKDAGIVWTRRDLKLDHQTGPGGTAVLWQDRLLIACDGMDVQYAIALDKMTGKTAWKSERSAIKKLAARPADMRKAFGTPVIFSIDGRAQALTTAAERLYSHDPKTGEELWFVDIPGFSNVPLPVSDGKMAFVCTGFMKPEVWGVKLGGARGDATASHVVWKQKTGAPDQSTPLVVGNRLYIVTSGGVASCLDTADGRIVWKDRIGSDFASTPIYVGGRIYFFDTLGTTTVIAPGDTLQVLAKNTLSAGMMASPAITGKAFIVRTKEAVYRIEE